MVHIKRPVRIAILVLLALVLLGALWWQSVRIHRIYEQVNHPTLERRQLADPRIHSWMTAEEIAERCHVPIERVFTVLGITAQAGDEKLTVKKLEEKYGLTRDEVRHGLGSLKGHPVPPSRQES